MNRPPRLPVSPAAASPTGRGARSGSCVPLLAVLAVLAVPLVGPGCVNFHTTEAGQASNLVVDGALAYVALSGAGIGVVDAASGETLATVAPQGVMHSVDDLALADGLLFALDAVQPGYLAVFSLADARAPMLIGEPVPVPVGPFTGVSAAAGRVVVSGGTSELTLRRYDADGRLGGAESRADFGRGQPDVLLSPDGGHAYVSTHFSLIFFSYGVTVVRLDDPPAHPRAVGEVELDEAGFTGGGAKPANFPIELALLGDLLLVAHGGGLALVDVADPAAPRLRTVLPLELEAVNVDAAGDWAAVVGSHPAPALVLVDLSDPAAPTVERRIALPPQSRPTGVALAGDRILVAAQGAGVLVLER